MWDYLAQATAWFILTDECYSIINPWRMRHRVTVVILCVCLSVTKLAATYLVCESKVQHYKDSYGVPNAWFVWILLKTLCLSVLVSFADSKLLDFSQASDSLTLRINGMLCVARYIRCVCIINPRCMRFRHGTQRWSPPPPWSTGKLLIIMGWQWLFFNS